MSGKLQYGFDPASPAAPRHRQIQQMDAASKEGMCPESSISKIREKTIGLIYIFRKSTSVKMCSPSIKIAIGESVRMTF